MNLTLRNKSWQLFSHKTVKTIYGFVLYWGRTDSITDMSLTQQNILMDGLSLTPALAIEWQFYEFVCQTSTRLKPLKYKY